MKKLKDKLIHLFGGLTEEDIRVLMCPDPVRIEQRKIEKIRISHIEGPEYPDEYYTYVRQNMAQGICQNMLESGLIKFESDADPSGGIKLTATAMVVHPEMI